MAMVQQEAGDTYLYPSLKAQGRPLSNSVIQKVRQQNVPKQILYGYMERQSVHLINLGYQTARPKDAVFIAGLEKGWANDFESSYVRIRRARKLVKDQLIIEGCS